MQYSTGTTEFTLDRPSVVTLGKFDGMHKGHQKLLNRVLEISQERNLLSVLFTFDVSPAVILKNGGSGMLLTNEERRDILCRSRLDWLVECPFEKSLMHMEAEDFVRDMLVKRLRAAMLVVGPDFRFGHQRKGTPELLKRMGAEYGFSVEVLDKETYKGEEISSTRIREAVLQGQMDEVGRMLGFPYFLSGEIIHGRQLGRKLGIPTTNLRADGRRLLPPFGVYITRNIIGDRDFGGITNIGTKPTVNGEFVGVETHLFSCNMNLYGENERVELLKFLRKEKKFNSVEELKRQILADEEEGRQYISGYGTGRNI
ncbi:MAG TPA: bifunctional riboflavin kinase/FAD synthetase [Lachnospiraceae bacterium]|nr:bifunctional riboflavin kinase/FAD synthetase [Lachnospiraceae bacterium]